jgi:hypothetical protein
VAAEEIAGAVFSVAAARRSLRVAAAELRPDGQNRSRLPENRSGQDRQSSGARERRPSFFFSCPLSSLGPDLLFRLLTAVGRSISLNGRCEGARHAVPCERQGTGSQARTQLQ